MSKKLVIEFNGKEIEGILINEDDKFLILKLDSGYNGSFLKENIKIISEEELDVSEFKSDKSNSVREDTKNKKKSKKLKKITILHTGGTIASKVDYRTGAVSSKFTAEELLNLFPELNDIAEINPKMIGNLFSEDMRFSHYNIMLSEIEKAIEEGSSGVIISHGTDTMHYTAPALFYAMKNISIPIILVGAQRSSDRASSDAFSNLSTAINFILEVPEFNRVGICMHKNIDDNSFLILDSINSKKLHSSRRDAFKQINYLPFAEIKKVGLVDEIKILRKDLLENLHDKESSFSYVKYDENLKIGFFKAHPNLFPFEIKNLNVYDAVILEGTGLGHLAINEVDENTKIHKENLKELENLSNKTKLVMGVQTVFGEVNLNVYSSGRDLQKIGILGNLMNLCTETLFVRVAFCLSQKDKDFTEIWNENLEGFEIRSEDIVFDKE